jgi:iron complex outermembrane receptor protein
MLDCDWSSDVCFPILADTRLDPQTQGSRGRSSLAAAVADWRLARDTRLEVEVEASRQRQPSTPGFSLLGARLPDPSVIDPRINLNQQAWTLPVVLAGTTGSVRASHVTTGGTELAVHAMRQDLRNDDRVAFPYGCSASGLWDRYCADGSFDVYDYRSEGERRVTDALELSARGQIRLGATGHQWRAALLQTRHVARFNRQAYNWVGTGTADGRFTVPADPALTDENTDRDERSTELALQDAATLSPTWSLWGGLRHSRLDRRSVRTDGSRETHVRQSFTTPWLAVSHVIHPGPAGQTLAYASWGEGVEKIGRAHV